MFINKYRFIFIVFVLLLSIFSCSNSTKPEDSSPFEIATIANIQWNLSSVETPLQIVNLDDYEPFWILFWSARIFGSDHCNQISGDYSINNDSLIITDVSATEMGCSFRKFFPYLKIFRDAAISMRGKQLVFLIHDTTYVFSSNFTEDISNKSFLNDTLTLKNSNDTNFTFLNSVGCHPKLILTSGREYALSWYITPPVNTYDINQSSGIFGVNEDNKILFTELCYTYNGNKISINDRNLAYRIVCATSFDYNNGILKIVFDAMNTFYVFEK